MIPHTCSFYTQGTRVQQRIEVIARRTSRKKFGLFSILHSSEFSSVVFKAESHIVPLALAVVKATAKHSRSPNLVAHDANFDGLNIVVASHAFNSFESMHNSMISSSLRSSTKQSGLSDSTIFSNNLVLFTSSKAVHLFGRCICRIPDNVFYPPCLVGRHLNISIKMLF